MATIADKLTTIAGIKTDIRTAINNKGGSLTSGSPFSAYSAAISSLPSGGGGGGYPPDWTQIGYTGTPQLVLDGFSHAKTIYDNWDPTVTNLRQKFLNDTSLVYMPMVETSGVTDMNNMFYGCANLTVVPLLDTSNVTNMAAMFHSCGITSVPAFNTSACTNMSYMLAYCSRLVSVPQFDTSSVTDMSFMFVGCSNLTYVPLFDTSSVISMGYMFSDCKSLQQITSLDLSKCTNFSNMFNTSVSTLYNLRFMLLKGLGTPSGVTSYVNSKMERCSNWGVADDTYTDARQSLVDSLLTYSFDRTAAGYATCTIKLHRNSYSQLTAEEIADIEAKGYSITK